MLYSTMTLADLKIQYRRNIYCFGAGRIFDSFMQEFAEFHLENHIKAVVDNNVGQMESHAKTVNGTDIPIVSLETLLSDIKEQDCILITMAAYQEVIQQLEAIERLHHIKYYLYSIVRIEQYDYDRRHVKMPSEIAAYKEIRIPKVIHYCWFGKQKIPDQYRRWMESWKKWCPDYEIVEWNEDNYDVHKSPYISQAYDRKKWAFVSDYARIDIVNEQGGVYLDTDVELIKNIDELLQNDAFCGFESRDYVAFGLGFGAGKNNTILREIKEYYDNTGFVMDDGTLNQVNCPVIQTAVMQKHGLQRNGGFQQVEDMTVYPSIVLCGMSPHSFRIECDPVYTYAVHHFAASWKEGEAVIKRNAEIADIRKLTERENTLITIFTPVYNRAHIIGNLYQSLLRQTSHDFEWLIVDDGSTDNIAELVHQWAEDTQSFQIRLYQQENGGKHRAVNYGVKLSFGEAFFIVDSDDFLEDNAVEIIAEYWKEIKENRKIAGIAGLKRYGQGGIIGGTPHFDDFIDATNLERGSWGLHGDKAEVYRTELLRQFPFPEYQNETFITEAVVWDQIAYEGYQIRWINKPFMICDYQADGLTAGGEKLFIDNPRGWAHYIRAERKYRKVDKEQYFLSCCRYYECEYGKFTDNEIQEMLGLCDKEYRYMADRYNTFFCKLNRLCENRKVCIYAYGRWGKRLKEYLEHLGIQVDYVVDRQYENITEIEAYPLSMDLPQADIIFIALKNGAEEAAEAMKRKLPGAEVVLFGDIKPY